MELTNTPTPCWRMITPRAVLKTPVTMSPKDYIKRMRHTRAIKPMKTAATPKMSFVRKFNTATTLPPL